MPFFTVSRINYFDIKIFTKYYFIESLFWGSSSNDAMPLFVFRHRLVCVQNAFGVDFAFNAISRSSFLFAFRRSVFTLFRARAYWERRVSFAELSLFNPLIQAPCDLCFSLMALLTSLLIGTLPLHSHVGLPFEFVGTNSSLNSRIFDLREFSRISGFTSVAFESSMYCWIQPESINRSLMSS